MSKINLKDIIRNFPFPEDSTISSQSEQIEESRDLLEVGENIQDPPNSSTVIPLLKEHPNIDETEGPDVHEEVAVRWLTYLKEGLSVKARKELVQMYKIPKNCRTLKAPLLNEEIKTSLPTKDIKNNQFLSNIQGQIGASLSALGSVLSDNHRNRNIQLSKNLKTMLIHPPLLLYFLVTVPNLHYKPIRLLLHLH